MSNSKGRLSTALAALAATFVVAASVLSPIPSASAATVPAQSCTGPKTLSLTEEVALQKRMKGASSQQVANELLCLTTVGSNAKPGGELKVALKLKYKKVEIAKPIVIWYDGNGKSVGASNPVPDGAGGWNASLKLTEAHSGKAIKAQVSSISGYLETWAEQTIPEKWDQACLDALKPKPTPTPSPTPEPTSSPKPTESAAPEIPKPIESESPVVPSLDAEPAALLEAVETPDKSNCLIHPEYTVTEYFDMWIENGKLSSDAQTVAFNPVVVAKPTLTGTALVGNTLGIKLSGTSKAQKISYQWLRNGAAIKGATASKYKVQDTDMGKKVSVRITGTSTGQKTVVQNSPASGKVLKKLRNPNPVVASATKGKISCPMHNCTAKLKAQITSNPGATVQYQWYRNGKAIKGATKSTYNVKYKYAKNARANVKYSIKVTVKKANHVTVTQTGGGFKLPK